MTMPNEKSQTILGKNLRSVREEKNLSQENVAVLSKISTTYYAGIERGEENPTFLIIESICKALHIKSSQVMPF